jgi:hypothetical protein
VRAAWDDRAADRQDTGPLGCGRCADLGEDGDLVGLEALRLLGPGQVHAQGGPMIEAALVSLDDDRARGGCARR